MPTTKLRFSLEKPDIHGWIAILSDGAQEAIITASSALGDSLLPML